MKKKRLDKIASIWQGLVCGVITGLLVFCFKLAATKCTDWGTTLYRWVTLDPIRVLILVLTMGLFATCMFLLHKLVPEAKGGGIPRSEGVIRGALKFRPLRTLAGVFGGSCISFLGGIPVGSEGPAVLMGTAVGSMVAKCSRDSQSHSNDNMTGGASAGFAVATGAPLAGILFAVEEIHKRVTPRMALVASVAVLSATFVNEKFSNLLGLSTSLFHLDSLSPLDFSFSGYLLLLGLLVAVAVVIFDGSIHWFHLLTKKISHGLKPWMKILLVFFTTIFVGSLSTDAIFSGHHTIHHALSASFPITTVAFLLIFRMIMMLLVTDSGVTGGIFIPTMAIGALVSALCSRLLVWWGAPEEIFAAMVFLGMCSFIGGTLRAPFTAALLYVELTGHFSGFFPVALVVFTVNLVTTLVAQLPFYDRVIEDLARAEASESQVK